VGLVGTISSGQADVALVPDQTFADWINNTTSATRAALSATYAARTGDHSGASPYLEKATLGAGALLHLIAGVGSTAPYVVGIGVDEDSSPTGLVVSVKKNSSIGIAPTLESTSGAASTGLLGQTFGPGTLVKLVQGSTATGPLLDLRNDFAGASSLLQWGVGSGDVKGYIGSAGDFVVQYGASASKNAVRFAPSSGSTQQVHYVYSGSAGLWFSSGIASLSNSMQLQSGAAAAAIGSETLNNLIELKNGNSLGFYGVTPVTRATVAAAATDAATTQTLANDLRSKLIALGLAQ